MAIAADTAADRVEQLITLTIRLTGLIRTEIAHLNARDFDAAEAVRAEAAPLVSAHRHEAAAIAQDPDRVAGAPADRRNHLAQLTEIMHVALGEHAEVVAALRAVTEGLIHAVAQHVADTRKEAAGYRPGAAAPAAASQAITLNKTA